MKKDFNGFWKNIERIKIPFFAILAVLLIAVPFMGFSNYIIRVFCMIFIYAVLTISLNVVTGYLGATSMGHAALYCIGAYAGALISTRLGWNFCLALVASIAIGLAAGAFLGVCTMRLSGSYMTVTTLAFAQVVTMIAQNWTSLTNGTLGVKGIPDITIFGITMTLRNGGLYFIGLVLLLICVVFMQLVARSKYGRAFIAVRDDSLSARMMGLNVKGIKVLGCAISGALAGLIGCYYSYLVGYIDPMTFSFDISMTILTMAILGGLASVPGSIAGAAILTAFPEVLRSLNTYRFFLFGFILVVMMRIRPQGILGGIRSPKYKLPKGVSRYVSAAAVEQEVQK